MNNDTNKKMFRLATMIYSDEVGEETRENILEKIITTVFLEKNNERMTIQEIIENTLEIYKIEFSDDEIKKILVKKDRKFLSFKKRYNLLDNEYLKLKSERSNEIEIIKNNFYNNQKEEIEKKELFKILDTFFYYIINLSIHQINDLIATTKIDEVLDNKFDEIQMKIINNFLKWDNNEKDKLIFKMYNLGIEYSLLTVPNKSFDFLSCIKDKVLYLDCNILYRALGLNGENRKKSINTLLEKCVLNNEQLIISNATYLEFKMTFEYHSKKIQSKENGEKLESILLRKFTQEGTIYYSFYEWKLKKRAVNSLNNFKFEVKTELKNLLDKYNIKIEKELEDINEKEEKKIMKIEKEIQYYTSEKNEANLRTDALNIYEILEKRNKNKEVLEMENYYMLTADKSLLPLKYNDRPLALYPSQWLSILLKYSGRTEDDFSSFKEFVKIGGNKEVLDIEKTYAIVDGIMRCAKELEAGEAFADYLIEKNIFEKAKMVEIDEIEKIIIEESENYVEERIKEKESKLESEYKDKIIEEKYNLEEKLNLKQEKEKKELQDKIQKNEQEKEELQNKIQKNEQEKEELKIKLEKEVELREKIKFFSVNVLKILIFLLFVEHLLIMRFKYNPFNLIYLFDKGSFKTTNRPYYITVCIAIPTLYQMFFKKRNNQKI